MDIRNGSPQGIRLDNRTVYFWWGDDVDNNGVDSVAVADGRVLLFASDAECRAKAVAAGWPTHGSETDVINAGPVQDWLARRRTDLDPESALDVLNIAIDFEVATGSGWDPRWGRSKDVYTKLLAFNVPYLFDPKSYRSRWWARESAILRAVLGEAVGLLRKHIYRPGL